MAASWIFQANPSRFDITGFLATRPTEAEWLVSRYANEIAPGDRVFLWRSGSDKSQPAGVIAEAEAVTHVRPVTDDAPAQFWLDSTDQSSLRPRVRIALKRVAGKREVIKRDWWKEDPVLRDHLIMKMANHTTFRLEGPELSRLQHLWDRTGSDWTYEDAVAGLYAFARTKGSSVSRLPGSPVADVALLIGRPVSGTYNAVMNYRSLDPEDARTGLDGASDQLRSVWAQFYDGNGFHADRVQGEFHRLFVLPADVVDANAARSGYDEQAVRLSRELTLAELVDRYAKLKGKDGKLPRVRNGTGKIYERDPLVGAIARRRAEFRCEVPGCCIPLFIGTDGLPYIEVHHIQTLATGGDDAPENVVCLCPAHHREAHLGANAHALASILQALRASEIVDAVSSAN